MAESTSERKEKPLRLDLREYNTGNQVVLNLERPRPPNEVSDKRNSPRIVDASNSFPVHLDVPTGTYPDGIVIKYKLPYGGSDRYFEVVRPRAEAILHSSPNKTVYVEPILAENVPFVLADQKAEKVAVREFTIPEPTVKIP